MISSIVLVIIFASGLLSEGKKITAKDFPPKIPKIRPENMRPAQPFYCTDCCREDKGETTVTTASMSTNEHTTSSQTSNAFIPAHDTKFSDTTTIRSGGMMSPTSAYSAHYHVDSSNATLKSEMTEAVNVSHESTHVTGDSTVTASSLSTKEDTFSSKATNSSVPDQETTIGDNPTFANGGMMSPTSIRTAEDNVEYSKSNLHGGMTKAINASDESSQDTETPSSPSCPLNMMYNENYTCQGTCQDPFNCTNILTETEMCVCPEGFVIEDNDCIHESQCGCYVNEIIIPEGDFFLTRNCSEKCQCSNNTIKCNNNTCNNGSCEDDHGFGVCLCADGSYGNGLVCQSEPTDCSDVYAAGNHSDGIYNIKPTTWNGSSFPVFCNMSGEGGWTVIQRVRDYGEHDQKQFNWTIYKGGFGNLTDEFWIGNEKLFYLTNQNNYRLRVDVIKNNHRNDRRHFYPFWIRDEINQYRIRISDLGGTLGGFSSRLNGKAFSTSDRDNDESDTLDCGAQLGAGWYNIKQMDECKGVTLFGLKNSMKYMQMKIQPVSNNTDFPNRIKRRLRFLGK